MDNSSMESRVWVGLLLRGLAAILFGILALSRPGATAHALAYLFAIYAFVDGIFAFSASFQVAALGGRWWPLMFVGFCGVVIGILAFINPAATVYGLVYYIAFWAIATGILELAGAVRLRKVIDNEWMLAVAGLLSIAFGIMVAARPNAGALSLIWTIGAFAIIFGGLEIGLAFRLRGATRRLAAA